jgi:hypothetical protein
MSFSAHLKQPLAGIVATAMIIAISLGLISRFSYATFTGWISYALMCLIPMQIVTVALWKTQSPAGAASRRQPLKGLLLILITVLIGAIVGIVHFASVGGAIAPPNPVLIQCIIVSVVVMFWLGIMWGGWPFTTVFRNPVASGFAALVASYVLNLALFRLLFNYDFLKEAPVYVPSLDPQGLFSAWNVLVFYVTCLAVMFLMLHFDLWPLTKFKTVMAQPVLGLVWTGIVLLLGGAFFLTGTQLLQMDVVEFLVRVPIPFIFGTIVVLNMLQNSLFSGLAQPLKGIANAVTAAAAGTALAMLYRQLSGLVTGPLASGPPAYEAEIWLASALLSVTFPFLIFHAELLGFWPLKDD